MLVIFLIFVIFSPLIDYHYRGKNTMIFTHISLYDLLSNKYKKKGYIGFFGGDIEGQLNHRRIKNV